MPDKTSAPALPPMLYKVDHEGTSTLPPIPEILPAYAPRDPAGQIAKVRDVLERWHSEVHDGSFRFCYERPCREIAGVTRGLEL